MAKGEVEDIRKQLKSMRRDLALLSTTLELDSKEFSVAALIGLLERLSYSPHLIDRFLRRYQIKS